MDWLAVLLIAYLQRGAARVLVDIRADPIDQPGYARSGRIGMILVAGVLWWWRKSLVQTAVELGWTIAIFAALYWLLGLAITSSAIRLAILCIPLVHTYVAAILSRR